VNQQRHLRHLAWFSPMPLSLFLSFFTLVTSLICPLMPCVRLCVASVCVRVCKWFMVSVYIEVSVVTYLIHISIGHKYNTSTHFKHTQQQNMDVENDDEAWETVKRISAAKRGGGGGSDTTTTGAGKGKGKGTKRRAEASSLNTTAPATLKPEASVHREAKAAKKEDDVTMEVGAKASTTAAGGGGKEEGEFAVMDALKAVEMGVTGARGASKSNPKQTAEKMAEQFDKWRSYADGRFSKSMEYIFDTHPVKTLFAQSEFLDFEISTRSDIEDMNYDYILYSALVVQFIGMHSHWGNVEDKTNFKSMIECVFEEMSKCGMENGDMKDVMLEFKEAANEYNENYMSACLLNNMIGNQVNRPIACVSNQQKRRFKKFNLSNRFSEIIKSRMHDTRKEMADYESEVNNWQDRSRISQSYWMKPETESYIPLFTKLQDACQEENDELLYHDSDQGFDIKRACAVWCALDKYPQQKLENMIQEAEAISDRIENDNILHKKSLYVAEIFPVNGDTAVPSWMIRYIGAYESDGDNNKLFKKCIRKVHGSVMNAILVQTVIAVPFPGNNGQREDGWIMYTSNECKSKEQLEGVSVIYAKANASTMWYHGKIERYVDGDDDGEAGVYFITKAEGEEFKTKLVMPKAYDGVHDYSIDTPEHLANNWHGNLFASDHGKGDQFPDERTAQRHCRLILHNLMVRMRAFDKLFKDANTPFDIYYMDPHRAGENVVNVTFSSTPVGEKDNAGMKKGEKFIISMMYWLSMQLIQFPDCKGFDVQIIKHLAREVMHIFPAYQGQQDGEDPFPNPSDKIREWYKKNLYHNKEIRHHLIDNRKRFRKVLRNCINDIVRVAANVEWAFMLHNLRIEKWSKHAQSFGPSRVSCSDSCHKRLVLLMLFAKHYRDSTRDDRHCHNRIWDTMSHKQANSNQFTRPEDMSMDMLQLLWMYYNYNNVQDGSDKCDIFNRRLEYYGIAAYRTLPAQQEYLSEFSCYSIPFLPISPILAKGLDAAYKIVTADPGLVKAEFGTLISPMHAWMKARLNKYAASNYLELWQRWCKGGDGCGFLTIRGKCHTDTLHWSDYDFVGLFLNAWCCEEHIQHVKMMCRLSFFAKLYTCIAKSMVFRGSITNPDIQTTDDAFLFKSRGRALEDAHATLVFVEDNFGPDFLSKLRKLPPAFILEAYNYKGTTEFLKVLLYDTHTDKSSNAGKKVLEWATKGGRNSCDAMSLLCRMHSKMRVSDLEFDASSTSLRSVICKAEGVVMRKSEVIFRNAYDNASIKLDEYFKIPLHDVDHLQVITAEDFNRHFISLKMNLRNSCIKALDNSEETWRHSLARVELVDIIGSYGMGRIAQVYDELRGCGGNASPLSIVYGPIQQGRNRDYHHHYQSVQQRCLDVHDACRCLPDAQYLRDGACYVYYATDPGRKKVVRDCAGLARVRAETQRVQGILSEAFLTQRASNETMMGWSNKSDRGMRMAHEARQRVLLSLMARKQSVYACFFTFKEDPEGLIHWCVGLE